MSVDCEEYHVLLQDLALCRLRVAKIHHFIQKLIDYNKIVSYTFFFKLLEVFDENMREPVEEEDDFCCVGVVLG